MSEFDPKALEAAQRAYMLASHCGLSLGHERVFCDDARLPDSVRCSPGRLQLQMRRVSCSRSVF